MEFKNFIFFLLSLYINLIKIYHVNAKETEFEKIKNTIISMFSMESIETTPPFIFKFKKMNIKFKNFVFFDISNKSINLLQDKYNNSIFYLNNITITFKSDLEINFFDTNTFEFLMEVYFETISFIKIKYSLIIDEVIPKTLYISKNSQIGQLSYFDEFNNMEKATFTDENGKQFSNVDIQSALLDISKNYLVKKMKYVKEHFNLLTYEFDQILNNIVGQKINCSSSTIDDYGISSFEIEKINVSLKSIEFVKDLMDIRDMRYYGSLFLKKGVDELTKINFEFYNTKTNYAIFEKKEFDMCIKQDNINLKDRRISQLAIYQALKINFVPFVKQIVDNYYLDE